MRYGSLSIENNPIHSSAPGGILAKFKIHRSSSKIIAFMV
jgi:hypothetical protein